MKKDRNKTVRVNSEVDEKIKQSGMTLQKIIDEWISENYHIEEETTVKISKK